MNAVLWLLLCLMSGTAAFRTLAPAAALHLQLKPRGLASRRLRYLPTKLCAKCDVEFLREMLPEGTNVAHKLMDLEATNVALARCVCGLLFIKLQLVFTDRSIRRTQRIR